MWRLPDARARCASCRTAGRHALAVLCVLLAWWGAPWAQAQPLTVIELTEARLIGAAGERTVTLPHTLAPRDFAAAGGRVRYRMEVELQRVPAETLSVFVPKMSLAGALRVNGAYERACEPVALDQARCLHRPHFFETSGSLWRAGRNVVEFEIYADSRQMNGLSRVYVGETAALYPTYLTRYIVLLGSMGVMTVLAVFVGLLALVMSRYVSDRPVYVWFAMACLGSAVANLNYLVNTSFGEVDAFRTYAFASRLVAVTFVAGAMLAVCHEMTPTRGRLLLGYAALMPLVVWATGNDRGVVSLLYLPLMALAAWLIIVLTRLALSTGRAFHRWMLAAFSLLAAISLLDFARMRGASAFEGVYLIPYASSMLMIAIGFRLTAVIGHAFRQSRLTTQRLEEEVARRTAQLTQAKGRLEEMVAERTQELRQALASASQSAQAKSRFLAVMSHEIRTPLAGLIGTLQLACEKASGPGRDELLNLAHASCAQLSAILDNVIDVSKLREGALTADLHPVDLVQVCRSATEGFGAAFAAKAIALRFHAPEPALTVVSDGIKVRQILDNLLSNALKFTSAGSVGVSLRVIEEPAASRLMTLELSVRDTGCGVPADRRDLIFDLFEQGSSEGIESRPHDGSGLGLTLCRLLAGLLGGGISHQDNPGGGSVFTVRFKAVEASPLLAVRTDATPDPEAGSSGTGMELAGRRVLVVDDNRVIQTVIRRKLELHGAVPTLASHAEEALSLVRAEAFDAILMDVSMPGKSGLACAREIRGYRREDAATDGSVVPIIGISAHTMPGDAEACLASGMNAYVPKPIDWDLLIGQLMRARRVGC